MTKRKHAERRLIVVSKRRQPTDEGLARLVAAMVLYRIEQAKAAGGRPADAPGEDGA